MVAGGSARYPSRVLRHIPIEEPLFRPPSAAFPALVQVSTYATAQNIAGKSDAELAERGAFTLPPVERMLEELREIAAGARPTDALFRTNHASNHLPLAGRLPRDRDRILEIVDRALSGAIRLRPEWARGL